ncbi:MAG: triose-phosphate isomerase, partial [Minisyncoccales bacterium]
MKLIVANWKCNPTNLKKARKLFYSAKRGVKNIKNLEVVICPPFVWLSAFSFQLSANLKLGAQDCFWQEGAFTGEVSARMLKDLGVDYVIVGHSERRKYFSETDEMINKKLKSALKAKLKPILCIGETEKERKRGKTSRVLKNQLKKALKNLTIGQFNNLTIAYEPVWAIGTGNPCSPEDAKKALIFLKKI